MFYFFLILSAFIVHSIQIRLAATNALLNSLEFSKQNFEREVFTFTISFVNLSRIGNLKNMRGMHISILCSLITVNIWVYMYKLYFFAQRSHSKLGAKAYL